MSDAFASLFPALCVRPVPTDLDAALRTAIDQKTKPLGALGRLEAVAFQVGRIRQSLRPDLTTAAHLVFAADHGVCDEGVSPYPQAVTTQMVLNFLGGGAAINVFCRQVQVALTVVDAGVAGALPAHPDLLPWAVCRGSRNMVVAPALSATQVEQCLQAGARAIDERAGQAALVSLGEMGIGNTTVAAALFSAWLDWPPEICVGAGTGASETLQAHKAAVIRRALQRAQVDREAPLQILAEVGGAEVAMMVGAYLRAAALSKVILVDGFIATAAWCIAQALQPALREYSLFAHQSDEQGHARVLAHLGLTPLLQLGMRLGEGTGAMAALPLVRMAAAFLGEMASFAEAGVSASA